MSDPISLIALGAAVGGAAGKFAEKAWESAQKWLVERFGTHAAEAQAQARVNAADFVRELAAQLSNLEAQRQIEKSRIEAVGRHPQFSTLLQRSLLNAAETEESSKHTLLANLVAARLLADSDTTLALASTLASDAITRSTKRQLKLMALCSFLFEVRPRSSTSLAEYRHWLSVWLKPFVDFEFKEIDARHLVAIACASYDPTKDRDLQAWLGIKLGPEYANHKFEDIIEVEVLQYNWTEGLSGIALTSVGSIVGALALDQVMGVRTGLPMWD